jgi:pre-mRNA-splicing factor 38A
VALILPDGSFVLTNVDVVVDQLLTQDRVFDIILPRISKRNLLEETQGLAARPSILESLLDESGASSPSEEQPQQETKQPGGLFKNQRASEAPEGSQKSKESLSIEATNELRAKLGLKPLQM